MKKLFVILFAFVFLASYSQMFVCAEEAVTDIAGTAPDASVKDDTAPDTGDDTVGATAPKEDSDKETAIEIEFSTERLPTALEHMGVGLAGVMLVLILIGLVVFVLNKVFKPA